MTMGESRTLTAKFAGQRSSISREDFFIPGRS
eukprot:CAMPEP_0179480144 /NCGR_PEP_ID=MMETSP0799-20121207/58194_1 /TAXON_ID=46947 /ORGANISM="Geminigera cryophila, Strain CCMP2564" /LENGTH=31 /DNA_ID= /DNA_START= /DNA_END= /DNA_ORIENTATION=